MFEIEKNVPTPRGKQYPFHQMEIGDSFLAAGKTLGQVSAAKFAFCQSKAGKGRKYSCRTVEGGIRVWREE